MSTRKLERMTWQTRLRLSRHVAQHGAEVRDLGVPVREASTRYRITSSDAERLCSWVRHHGLADPLRLPDERRPDPVPRPAAPDGPGPTHLVIGDAHAKPDQDLRRFRWLGRMIAELRPDVVVSIGDWADMESVCFHASAKDREGGRILDDLAAAADALDILEAELPDDYRPRKVITLGNHDDPRIDRLADDAPYLEGAIPTVGTAFESHGWEVHRYEAPARIDGVRYQHDLRVKGRVVAGKYHAQQLLDKTQYDESITVGHSHGYQQRWYRTQTGRVVRSLVAGCYFEEWADYAGQDNHHWWRGILVCHDVRAGDYRLEEWPLDRIRERWGDE